MCQDAKQEWLDGGMKKIESLWGGQAKRGRLSKEKFKEYMGLSDETKSFETFSKKVFKSCGLEEFRG